MLAVLLALAQAADTTAADSARTKVRFGAFIDTYYAWDTGEPADIDRPFTTQPARHNEFNVNLAFVEAVLAGDRIRGRVALQAGTSVQANYAAEPSIGEVAGADLAQLIQEGVAGVRVARGLWIDAGIYFSYIGQEGWISRDNPTYTRSLIADYTPYYLSGVKATWEPSSRVTLQAHLLNGWQNISETNGDKALGARVDWRVTPLLVLAGSLFVGNEEPDSLPSRTRVYSQAMVRWAAGAGWDLYGTLDVGMQQVPTGGSDRWWGFSAIATKALSPSLRLAGRVERLADPEEVVVVTGTGAGFETWSASLGVDVRVERRVLWRTEVRGYRSTNDVWPRDGVPATSDTSLLLVTSLALSL